MLAAQNTRHPLAIIRLRVWFSPLDHDAVEGETRTVVVADHDDGFGPGFDREVEATLDEGVWRDAESLLLGPIVAVKARHARRALDCSETIDCLATPEALAYAASMSGLRSVVACLGGALFGFEVSL